MSKDVQVQVLSPAQACDHGQGHAAALGGAASAAPDVGLPARHGEVPFGALDLVRKRDRRNHWRGVERVLQPIPFGHKCARAQPLDPKPRLCVWQLDADTGSAPA